jgi:hypothetical protein
MFGTPKSLQTGILIAAVALMVVGTSGLAASDPPIGEAHFVDGDIDTLPRIRFADGLVSLNDRCPVRLVPLNLRMPPVYVNGRPVGFC